MGSGNAELHQQFLAASVIIESCLVRVEEAFKNLKGDLASGDLPFKDQPGSGGAPTMRSMTVASLPRIPAARRVHRLCGRAAVSSCRARWRMYSK